MTTVTRELMRERALEEIDVLREAVENDKGADWHDAHALGLKGHHVACCIRDYTAFMMGKDAEPRSGFSVDVRKRLRKLIRSGI